MKKIILTGSLLSIYLLSFTAVAQSSLEDCLAHNKDPEHGETACYSAFIKQAQQKSKDKFQNDLQKNTSDLQEATKKANEDQKKQLEKSYGSTQTNTSPSSTTSNTSKSQPTTTTKTTSPSSSQQLKIEEEPEETKSIPYY